MSIQLQYKMPLLFVTDIQKSKTFYHEQLHLPITYDTDDYLVFGDQHFSVMQKTKAQQTLLGTTEPTTAKGRCFSIHFETPHLDELYNQLQDQETKFIHMIKEETWGQRVFRLYDPDRHLIEIAEDITSTIQRLNDHGLNATEIHEKTGLDLATIYSTIRNQHIENKS